MKYMLMSTSTGITTGYGIVSKNLMKGLLKKNVDIQMLGMQNIGHQKEEWNLPILDNIYGADALELYTKLYGIDSLITILDNWLPQYEWLPNYIKRLKLNHICHVTIHSEPLPPILHNSIRNANFWVAPSKFVEKVLLNAGYDPKRVRYIPHGVDTKIFKPLPEEEKQKYRELMGYENKFVWIAVATNTGFEKNWQGLFYAYKVFLTQNPAAAKDTVLHCHTSPHYPGGSSYDLEVLGKMYGIADNLRFVAGMNLNAGTPPEEMVRFYNIADCYISSTMGESFHLPALESMACGTPCIIPNHTTGPQLVGEPKTGLLAEPLKMKNGQEFGWTGPNISDKWIIDPVDMADKMTTIYKDKKLREKCSKNAVKFAKKFDWKTKIIPLWIDFFQYIENTIDPVNYKEKKLGI